MRKSFQVWIPVLFVAFATVVASAQSFRVQCPTTTITHPTAVTSSQGEPAYNGPTQFTTLRSSVSRPKSGDFVTPTRGP